jgi:DNA modification methylase
MKTDACYVGDCREILKQIAAEGMNVQMCVTSPPYWGLRDYGVKGQIGLERTPEEYVATMVEVFRLVREVLVDDGTLWLNLGDCYCGAGYSNHTLDGAALRGDGGKQKHTLAFPGLKPKDLIGMPWRVAFALQADGWYLRSDIIWHKPNPMPESVRDRPTRAHEYLFLLSKRPTYFYDAEAIAERARYECIAPGPDGLTRNRRTVWTITPEQYRDAHFATFPKKLVEPCILAGTSERGHCPECGARWERVVEKGAAYPKIDHRGGQRAAGSAYDGAGSVRHMSGQESNAWKASHPDKLLGWRPTCDHNKEPIPDVVLDPFLGSGTTAEVAQHIGRRYIGIELNSTYSPMQQRRTAQMVIPLPMRPPL